MRRNDQLWELLEALLFLVIFVIVVVFCSTAIGGPLAEQASCRIENRLGNTSDLGSGTLVDKTADGKEGLVLTCYHLFSDGEGHITVTFKDGSQHAGRLINYDKAADLAAIQISAPKAQPVTVFITETPMGQLYGYGFGQGRFAVQQGRYVGTSRSVGQVSIVTGPGQARSGDSGGGLFDANDRLVGVIWGATPNPPNTYACFRTPLRSFLYRVLQNRATHVVYDCPTGTCPIVRPPVVQPSQPTPACPDGLCPRPPVSTVPSPEQSILVEQLNEISLRLNSLEAQLAQVQTIPGPPGPPGPPGLPGRDATEQPFYIRVNRASEYQPVKPGQYVTLPLDKIMAQAQH